MEGKLYTAQEILDAIQEATTRSHDDDDIVKTIMTAKVGADIAYEVMDILGIDKDKALEYFKKKVEKKLDEFRDGE